MIPATNTVNEPFSPREACDSVGAVADFLCKGCATFETRNSIEPTASEPLLNSFGIRWLMFKADPEVADQHWDPFYSLTFSPSDIRDLRSFVKKLSRKRADPVSAWLWSQLDASVQSALQKYNDAQKDWVPLQWTLVQGLNKIIKGGRIDDKAPFDVKRQRLLTRSMIKQELHGSDLVRRNRMVLADQYPELAREPKKNISFPTTSGVTPLNSIVESERQNLENDHAMRRYFLWNIECNAENLNWLAGRDQKALGVLIRVSLSSAYELAHLTKHGHAQALRTLVELAEFATEAVRRFGTENTVIREMAKERLAWWEADAKRARELCAGIKEGEIVIFDKAYVDFDHLWDLEWCAGASFCASFQAVSSAPAVPVDFKRNHGFCPEKQWFTCYAMKHQERP
jgi:hypothetical protein